MVLIRQTALACLMLVSAMAVAPAMADPVRAYRYSVINQRGQVFSMTLKPVTQSLQRPGTAPQEITTPTPKGQRVLESSLRTAGVYDRPVGPSVPMSGRNALAHTGPVGVSIHYN